MILQFIFWLKKFQIIRNRLLYKFRKIVWCERRLTSQYILKSLSHIWVYTLHKIYYYIFNELILLWSREKRLNSYRHTSSNVHLLYSYLLLYSIDSCVCFRRFWLNRWNVGVSSHVCSRSYISVWKKQWATGSVLNEDSNYAHVIHVYGDYLFNTICTLVSNETLLLINITILSILKKKLPWLKIILKDYGFGIFICNLNIIY